MDRHNEGAVVGELAVAVELEAAEQQMTAREAWQRCAGRHEGATP